MIISPSILSADFSKLKEEIDTVSTAEFLHIDVMDGVFVPNISFGAKIQKEIRPHFKNMVFDTHLMIIDPIKYIKDFADAGSDYITFHLESNSNVLDTIEEIKKYNIKVGISIKPNTPVSELEKYLDKLDMVLVMSVEPGFGGQSFIPSAIDKIKRLNELKQMHGYNYLINVDGGINSETSKLVGEAGTDIIVVGSYLFKQEDRKAMIRKLSI